MARRICSQKTQRAPQCADGAAIRLDALELLSRLTSIARRSLRVEEPRPAGAGR